MMHMDNDDQHVQNLLAHTSNSRTFKEESSESEFEFKASVVFRASYKTARDTQKHCHEKLNNNNKEFLKV